MKFLIQLFNPFFWIGVLGRILDVVIKAIFHWGLQGWYAANFGWCEGCGKFVYGKIDSSCCDEHPKCIPMELKVRFISQERKLGVPKEKLREMYGDHAVDEYERRQDIAYKEQFK